jgi:hypothetical protein
MRVCQTTLRLKQSRTRTTVSPLILRGAERVSKDEATGGGADEGAHFTDWAGGGVAVPPVGTMASAVLVDVDFACWACVSSSATLDR